MQNRKYFPFERNSYYFGKLLTTRDFEDEQRYFNDKRRLLNRLTGSNGILSGLGVIAADDTSIVVQSGCALDASGREIIVPETRVIKLSTIDGYGQLTSDCAYLGIAYEEQSAETVYSVMSQNDNGQGAICNKIQEKYRLCLMDETQVNRIASPEEDFISSLIIYADQEIVITQNTPKYVTLGSDSIVRVEINKIGQGTGEYSFCYELDVPGFDTADGENALVISMSGVKLSFGERKSVTYRIKPRPHIWGGDSSVGILVKDLSVCKNDFTFTINKTLEDKMQPVQRDLNAQFLHNYYGKAMDKRLAESFDECLWIAKINLIRQGPSIILDRILPVPFGQYCYNAQQIMQLRALEQYYPVESADGAQIISADAAHPTETSQLAAQETQRSNACGVFELGLGLGYSTKDIILSDEIMHGLGKGPVCVEIGVEYITQGGEGGSDFSEIYLGDMELFDTEPHSREERVYKITKAVKVLPERGTFKVAVRLAETSGLISLRIRWYAMRLSEINQQIRSGGKDNRYILVNPDTLVLPPKGTAHIAPAFINMPAEACNFRTTDAEGGTVDNNGVYTAPSKEGVYEIRVEAVSDPSIYTHVFAIVTQKKKE